jgi:hypothetical protein
MRARFYAPSLGVFTQADTVAGTAQDPLSLNRYLYTAANPATLVDPDGHAYCGPTGSCVAARAPTRRRRRRSTMRRPTTHPRRHVGAALDASSAGPVLANRVERLPDRVEAGDRFVRDRNRRDACGEQVATAGDEALP